MKKPPHLQATPFDLLLPYQRQWVMDRARFKIWLKSRQIGGSLAAAFEIVADALETGVDWIVLSAGERQALEFMQKVHRVASIFGDAIAAETGQPWNPGLKAESVTFPTGVRILALPANPGTARGYSGNLLLDEFAFHRDPSAIWAAVFPIISNPLKGALKLRIISTPAGLNSKFADLWKTGADFSRHKTDIYTARDNGLDIDIELGADLVPARPADIRPPPRVVGEPTDRGFNVGLFLSIYAPYSEGPAFVSHLEETDGWEAVDAAYDDRPASTAQLIHPERYPDVGPLEVTVEDRSSDGWAPIPDDGNESEDEPRTETIGEATLFGTLWANGVIDRPLTEGAGEHSPYNYSHPITDGWAGDTFVAYENGDETGHVWTLAWDSEADAERFAAAYGELLERNGATELEDGFYRIPDEEFAGAYHVDHAGDAVTIVGGPTVEALAEIHDVETPASSAATSRSPSTPTSPAPAQPAASAATAR